MITTGRYLCKKTETHNRTYPNSATAFGMHWYNCCNLINVHKQVHILMSSFKNSGVNHSFQQCRVNCKIKWNNHIEYAHQGVVKTAFPVASYSFLENSLFQHILLNFHKNKFSKTNLITCTVYAPTQFDEKQQVTYFVKNNTIYCQNI